MDEILYFIGEERTEFPIRVSLDLISTVHQGREYYGIHLIKKPF